MSILLNASGSKLMVDAGPADPVQEIAELRLLLAEREAELAKRGPS